MAVGEKNLAETPADEDIWVTQRVSRGLDARRARRLAPLSRAAVIVECRPLPYRQRGKFYREGLRVVTPTIRRPAPDTFSPARQDPELPQSSCSATSRPRTATPEAVGVLLDTNGNLSEDAQQHLLVRTARS